MQHPAAAHIIALALGISLSIRAGVPYAPGKEPTGDLQATAEQLAQRHTLTQFLPSLETRESTDFILSPALLAQSLALQQPVQFDAVITLKRSIVKSDVALFARYWVSSNFYAVGIIWAEPNGRFLNFPAYPPSLQLVSLPEAYRINHSVFTNFVATFTKPLPEPATFTNQFGDYAISSVWRSEIHAATNPLFLAACEAAHSAKGPTIQRGVIPSTKIRLGLPGDGARVRIGETDYQVREFPAVDLQTGRAYELAFAPVDFSSKTVNLPQSIGIGLTNGLTLYRAELSRFRAEQFTTENIAAICQRYCGFSSTDLRYRALLDRYWKKKPEDVTADDRKEVLGLVRQYASTLDRDESRGEKLKRLNILMELERIVGDEEAQVRYFGEYLSFLRNNGLDDTMLVGGQNAVDTLMIWGRTSSAKRLMNVWAEQVRRIKPETVISFAKRELERDNLVTTLFLLDQYGHDAMEPVCQFRLAALRGLTVQRLVKFCADTELHASGEIAAGQIALARECLDVAMLPALKLDIQQVVNRLYGKLETATLADKLILKQVNNGPVAAN